MDANATLSMLLDDAFGRFGPSLLWNVRRPSLEGVPDPDFAKRLARKIAREGGAEAIRLADQMINAAEDVDAGSLSTRSSSNSGL
jgi:hypothetical protein